MNRTQPSGIEVGKKNNQYFWHDPWRDCEIHQVLAAMEMSLSFGDRCDVIIPALASTGHSEAPQQELLISGLCLA